MADVLCGNGSFTFDKINNRYDQMDLMWKVY